MLKNKKNLIVLFSIVFFSQLTKTQVTQTSPAPQASAQTGQPVTQPTQTSAQPATQPVIQTFSQQPVNQQALNDNIQALENLLDKAVKSYDKFSERGKIPKGELDRYMQDANYIISNLAKDKRVTERLNNEQIDKIRKLAFEKMGSPKQLLVSISTTNKNPIFSDLLTTDFKQVLETEQNNWTLKSYFRKKYIDIIDIVKFRLKLLRIFLDLKK